LKVEINQKLSGKKRTFLEQQGEDLQIFGSLKSEAAAKERNRAAQRAAALKQ
jgi:ribosomal protein L9